jgi:hypothetical protein
MWLRLFGTLALLLAGSPAVQAARLQGLVLANEVGGPGLRDVGVDAVGANRTETDGSGKFSLEFPHRQPGEPVRLSVNAPGYEVVNDVQLEATLPADPEAKPLVLRPKAESKLLSRPGTDVGDCRSIP